MRRWPAGRRAPGRRHRDRHAQRQRHEEDHAQGHLATGCEPGILNRQPHKRDGNKLCGLGTADDKRGIAVILDALKSLADAGWKDCATVPVRGNADEETARQIRASRTSARSLEWLREGSQPTAIGILPMPALIRASHSRGPVSCTDTPFESTATVTGMSRTSNS